MFSLCFCSMLSSGQAAVYLMQSVDRARRKLGDLQGKFYGNSPWFVVLFLPVLGVIVNSAIQSSKGNE